MSGLILCKDAAVKHPFYVKDLGINLYSAEELCYYIYNHVFLIEEPFFSEELLTFIGTECRLPELERKLRLWKNQESDLGSLLLLVLQDVHYYNETELKAFKNQMYQLRNASPEERIKQKADYMFRQKKYEAALHLYESILPTKEKPLENALFTGRVYYNRGAAYAQLFSFREAAVCFEKAYELLGQEDVLKHLYFLYQMEPSVPVRTEFLEQVPAEQQYRWKEEFETLRKREEFSGKALEARAALEKNSFRREAAVGNLLLEWKKEYRSLVKE